MGVFKKAFPGGIYPLKRSHEGKNHTKDKPIKIAKAPAQVGIPMSQHIGTPCVPVVEVGDTVDMGQMIGEAQGNMGSPVHSSVSGKVSAIEMGPHCSGKDALTVIIDNDFEDRQHESMKPAAGIDSLSREDILKAVRLAGINGMGGAVFPTHVKLSPPKDRPIEHFILNGCECEPYVTADHRLMLEHAESIVYGMRCAMKALPAEKGIIAIEDNKPDAIEIMKKAAEPYGIKIAVLPTVYPQGGEKQIIQAVLGKEVPSCGLPMDIGVIVINVGTAHAIAEALRQGKPLYERVVTVAGDVVEPKNLLVRIGTPIEEVIEQCGGFKGAMGKVIAGGPMMGVAQPTLLSSIIKSTSGIVVLNKKNAHIPEESPCIYCGRCAKACPAKLMPYKIDLYVEAKNYDGADEYNALDCIECGCCKYVCPASRELVDRIRLGKRVIQARMRKKGASCR
ncbi:MAG: electron transport complex subunit RsxC [Christensenellales bacterium]